jgi:hypothetical protein
MLVTSVSFFNEVATEREKNYAQNLCFKNYPQVVSFFNELEIKKLCSKPLFHFLTRLPTETQKTILKTSVSFFNEVVTETQKLSSNLSS